MLDAGAKWDKVSAAIDYKGHLVRGCLVTHEHSDHCSGLRTFPGIIKAYTSAGTADTIKALGRRIEAIPKREVVHIGEFDVLAFQTQHDAIDPVGFIVMNTTTGETLVYATDTYYIKYRFPRVHYWLIECNYQQRILDEQYNNGEIADRLYSRLMQSHMSLERLIETLCSNNLSYTQKIILIHLSDGRSSEKEMVDSVRLATGVDTVAASAGMAIRLDKRPF